MAQIDPRSAKRSTTHRPRVVLPRLSPAVIAAVLVVLILLNAVVLTWRWAAQRAQPARDYYTYQVQRWEAQLLERPDDPLIWTTLAGLYEDIGRSAQARSAYEESLRLDPGNPAALLYLGRVAAEEGDIETARAHLEHATRQLPPGSRYIAYFDLGDLERNAGETTRAVDAYERSVEDRGSFWNAHYQLAFLYEQQGRLDEALTSAERADLFLEDRVDLDRLIDRLRAAGARSIGAPAMETTPGME